MHHPASLELDSECKVTEAYKEQQQALNDIEVAVYAASVKIFERMEARGLMRGNGHHAAQQLADRARQALQDRLWTGDEIARG